jgi:LPXTG-motif cell wall-anchored protein
VVTELKRAPVRAIQPTGEEVQLAQVVTPPPATELAQVQAPAPAQVQIAQNSPKTLPNTGSSLPLIALLGLLALGGAAVIGVSRQLLVR